MKKSRLLFVLTAVFAAGFSSCEGVKYGAAPYSTRPESDIAVTIKTPGAALAQVSRAQMQEGLDGYSALLQTGDQFGVFTSDGSNANALFTVDAVANGTATAKGSFVPETSASVQLYAYFPYSEDAADPAAVPMTIPSSQSPLTRAFDPAACPLVGVAKGATIDGKSLRAEDYAFKHLGAIIRLTTSVDDDNLPIEEVNVTEPVRSITFEAPASKALSGDFTLNVATGAASYPSTAAEGANKLTLTFPAGTTIDNLDAFAVALPFSLSATDELKVTVATEIFTIYKTVAGAQLAFAAGEIAEVDIAIDGDCTIEVDPDAPKHPAAPEQTYISGTGTEFGQGSQLMRKVSEGEFEIYTRLTAGGVYGFSDQAEGGIKYQLINGSLYTGTEGIPTTADGIYYIKVNYATSAVTVQELTKVQWWRGWSKSTVDLEYVGNGKWKGENIYTRMGDTNTDNRYRFMVEQGGATYVWGYPASDHNPRPEPAPESYYNISIRPVGNIDQWSYSFKFSSAVAGQYVDMELDMSPDATAYTHSVTATPISITAAEPLTPASGASVDLNEEGGSTVFTWTEGESSVGTPSYQLLFYNGDNTLSTIATGTQGTATEVSMTNAQLNAVASSAGIKDGATGTIYWSVATISGSATRRSVRRPLNVTAIQTSVPTPSALYISGTGTEYGAPIAGAKAMRPLGEGKFEVYCRLTSGGAYRLTSGTSGSYRHYYINDGKFAQSQPEMTTATPAVTGVYRVTVDFVANTITTQYLDSVWFERGLARAADSRKLDYIGDGQWQYPSHTYADNDERYHFRVTYSIGGDPIADGGKWDEKWGNFTRDTQQPAAEWAVKVMVGRENFYESNPGEADWDYSFKLKARNPGTGVMTIHMNADTPYHEYVWQ